MEMPSGMTYEKNDRCLSSTFFYYILGTLECLFEDPNILDI